MTYTPGPWISSVNSPNEGAKYVIGAPVSDMLPAHAPRHIGNVYSKANARLIAAAPDLLEALQDCQEVMDATSGALVTGEYISPDEIQAQAEFMTDFAMKARAVIAKATA